jgi:predicted NBD/HSP70 family sugar kinase
VADLSHTVLVEREVPLLPEHTAESGMAEAVRLVDTLLDEIGATRRDVLGVGLGIPGPIDMRTGRIEAGSVLPEWVGVRAATAMGDRLGLPVQVDNDANLGALAEVMWGAARGHRNAAYLKVASGIGAGLVIDGRLYRGSAGTAGEIGHTTIDESGEVCRCGNRGCLETVASVPVLVGLLRNSSGGDITAADMLAMAGDGHAGCRRVIEDAGRQIGVAVANLCNLLNPDLVVVGGELAGAGDMLLEPLRGVLRRFAIPSVASTAVVRAELGRRSQMLGALALVLQSAALPAAGGRDGAGTTTFETER